MRGEKAPAAADVAQMQGCVCLNLRKATRVVTQFYDRALKPHRLRVTQLSVLAAAHLHGPIPLARLAEGLDMERTTLLRNVRPLVRRRLLEVSPEADSRRTEVRLTAAGRALLLKAYPAWQRAQDEALKSLRGSDLARDLELLGGALKSAR